VIIKYSVLYTANQQKIEKENTQTYDNLAVQLASSLY